jgi:cytochrome c oxidase subunit 2
MTSLQTPPTNQPPTNQWWKKHDVRRLLVLTVIFSAVIGYVGSTVQAKAMGDPASEVMNNVINLIVLFTWVSAPVAGFVAAVSVSSLLGKHHYGDNPPPEADHSISNSPRANSAWIVISGLLCLFALVAGLVALQDENESILDGSAMRINVVGQQWAWNYDYPASKGVRSDVLHLPVDQPIVFNVTSKDVKHSFWVVQMGIKIDANPGVFTQTAVTPDTIGSFDIRCAELCGLLHAYMQNKVIVQSRADFDAWLASQPDTSETTWVDKNQKPEEKGGNAA